MNRSEQVRIAIRLTPIIREGALYRHVRPNTQFLFFHFFTSLSTPHWSVVEKSPSASRKNSCDCGRTIARIINDRKLYGDLKERYSISDNEARLLSCVAQCTIAMLILCVITMINYFEWSVVSLTARLGALDSLSRSSCGRFVCVCCYWTAWSVLQFAHVFTLYSVRGYVTTPIYYYLWWYSLNHLHLRPDRKLERKLPTAGKSDKVATRNRFLNNRRGLK